MTDQFIGKTLADKYRVEAVLRDGGLGEIYRATHLLMEKPVTIKILAPALAVDEAIVKRFSAEARTVSHISHPNILNVTDFGTDKTGAVYIVAEGADGETLKQAINREGRFTLERAVEITRQIAAGLSAAHSYDIVHGNLNAENVLLTQTANATETIKILDFGAVSPEDDNLLSDESYAHRLEYLSPEQNASVVEPDARSDIYALGVMLYEMLAGEVPYAAETPTALLIKQAETPPAPLSAFRQDLPEQIEPIVLKALAKNPEMRYQTVAEFVNDLNRAMQNAGFAAVIVPNVAPETNNNNLWKTAFVVLAGIGLLAFCLIYLTQSKQTNPATQMMPDANGQPVQPLNPATGFNEQGAAIAGQTYSPDVLMPGGNSNMTVTPVNPNSDGYGDGYNPWARGGVPPPGAPTYVPPGGQMIDPNNPNSIFMQDGQTVILVPSGNTNQNVGNKAANNAPANKATPPAANTNQTVAPLPANSAIVPKPSPTPAPKTEKTPAVPKPSEQPDKKPSATDKSMQSGKQKDA